ncbi:MAG: hypothetical protein AB7F59_06110 [Bdellovibrionales bacterium]
MKKIFQLIQVLMFATITNAHANEQGVVEGTGRISVNLDYVGKKMKCETDCAGFVFGTFGLGSVIVPFNKKKVQKNETLDVPSRIFVSPWGQGKAKVGITLSKQKNCGATQMSFTGVEMASGAYELYPNGSVEPIGELIVLNNSIMTKFNRALNATTTGLDGNACHWKVASDTSVEFTKE